jgi:hypothetical protein
MSELIVTNAKLPLAIKWWARMHGCLHYHQRNGNFLIALDMDRFGQQFHTVISLSGYLPDGLEVVLDISDLAWPVQEALKDCFSQTVVEIEEIATIYNYDE